MIHLPKERIGRNARNLTLYGLRTAANNWEKENTKTMEETAFMTGKATTRTLFHDEMHIRVVRWVEATPRKKYIVKLRAMLSPERTGDKVANILNRAVDFSRHVEKCWWDARKLWCPEQKLWIREERP